MPLPPLQEGAMTTPPQEIVACHRSPFAFASLGGGRDYASSSRVPCPRLQKQPLSAAAHLSLVACLGGGDAQVSTGNRCLQTRASRLLHLLEGMMPTPPTRTCTPEPATIRAHTYPYTHAYTPCNRPRCFGRLQACLLATSSRRRSPDFLCLAYRPTSHPSRRWPRPLAKPELSPISLFRFPCAPAVFFIWLFSLTFASAPFLPLPPSLSILPNLSVWT